MTSLDKAEKIKEFAEEQKALRIEILDVQRKSPITQAMVVCTGTSQIHANAVADKIQEEMRKIGHKPSRRSNTAGSDGWILLDFGDVLAHVMLEEKRQFYDLESLWTSMPDNPEIVTGE